MFLIDTHHHIYLPQFDNDRAAAMERAAAAGVYLHLLPAVDSETHAAMLEVEARYSSCRAMMGLHPCSVTGSFEEELDIVKAYFDQRSFIAVGEIGLDFHWDTTYTKEQYEAFHRQIGLALEKNLPIVIHSRKATDECIAVVRQYPGLRGVFHCFSGTPEQAEAVLETGFYLGIGGVVTFKNGGLDAVIERTGLGKVVLETDAPYLAPVPYRGKRNEPSYLAFVRDRLAALTALPPEEVARITTENAKHLFDLSE
ncbi:MAG TPA: TatD family hydrolase [Chitinophagaceae bacterium]|jgi:TatD DNase family protein|nr:TatD family hydrolase [Chitinophagaceae bacterium]